MQPQIVPYLIQVGLSESRRYQRIAERGFRVHKDKWCTVASGTDRVRGLKEFANYMLEETKEGLSAAKFVRYRTWQTMGRQSRNENITSYIDKFLGALHLVENDGYELTEPEKVNTLFMGLCLNPSQASAAQSHFPLSNRESGDHTITKLISILETVLVPSMMSNTIRPI